MELVLLLVSFFSHPTGSITTASPAMHGCAVPTGNDNPKPAPQKPPQIPHTCE